MAVSSAVRPLWRPRARTILHAPAATPLALGLLAVASVLLRTVRLDVGFWIDEGLSVGIADRPLLDIPGVLRQDGSPPLYYMLLHVWIRLVGDRGEEATHALSLLVATVAIPAAFLLVRALLGGRAGWIVAVLVAFNPFLTRYAQETRMYALVVLLGIVACACFAGAFVQGRGRGWLAGFAAAFTALLYTHNWALFLGAGLALAWALLVALAAAEDRRALVRDGLLAAAAVGVLYAPWVPSMLYQAAHTGAPWGQPPTLAGLVRAPEQLLGPATQYVLLVGVGAGLVPLLRRRARGWSAEARAAVALLLAAFVTLALPWLVSQVAPAWAVRYMAAALAPLLLAIGIGLARAGTLGIAVVALVAVMWLAQNGPSEKSNARELAAALEPALAPGDLVLSTQPEQVPVLHHYLRDAPGLRWATVTGPLTELGVTDWRDGVDRLRASSVERDLEPLLAGLAPGGRLVLVQPVIATLERWSAPWTSLVRQRSTAWEHALRSDARFRVVGHQPAIPPVARPNALRATVLVRVGIR